MTSKQKRALEAIQESVKTAYPEFGIEIDGICIFSMIPNDAPPFGAIMDNIYAVDPDEDHIYKIDPVFYMDKFHKALEHPFYEDIRNQGG